MKTKSNLIILIMAFILFIMGIAQFGYFEYKHNKETLYKQIDEKLLLSTNITNVVLSPEYHDRAVDATSITAIEYNREIDRLSEYAKNLQVVYIYTMIEKNGKIHFTASSATDEERKTGVNLTHYFDQYDDASDELKKVFHTHQISFDEYTDKWGTFRSIFVPMKSPEGNTYVIAADIRIDLIHKLLRDDFFELLLRIFGLVVFTVPLFLWYLRVMTYSLKKEKQTLVRDVETGEKNLNQTNLKLRSILDATQDSIFLLDRNTVILDINSIGAKRLGKEPIEMVGQSIFDFIPPDLAQRRQVKLEEVFRTGKGVSFDDEWNGIFFSFHFYPIYDDNGVIDSLTVFGKDITESRKLEEDLKNEHQHLLSILWGTGAGTWEWNILTDEIHVNEVWTQMLEYALQELTPVNYTTWETLVHPEDLTNTLQLLQEHFNGKLDYYECEFRMHHKEGHWVWIHTRGKVISVTTDGKPLWMAGVHMEISERKNAQSELHKVSQAVEQSPASIIITDLFGNIEYVNKTFLTTNGYSHAEVIGKNPRLFSSGKTPRTTYEDMWEHLLRGESWRGEFFNRSKDGIEYIQSVNISPIFQPNGKISNYMAIEEDITAKKRSEARIHYLANFDSLTGLPNRVQLEELIKYSINITKRQGGEFAVLFLDLDHFKNINDTLGHHIGDLLLIEMAKRFQSILRDEDTVARSGGDEFIFILLHINKQGVAHVAQKLLEAIARPFIIEQNELIVTASIGIAVYPVDGMDYANLSKNADAAMYYAKQDGRNKYFYFTQEMQESSVRNLQLSNALHHALERNQLHVVYQPQISLDNGHIIGAEALLRWTHPEFGSVSPAEFITIAEDTGLILPIGEWVLRSVVKQVKTWLENGFSPIIVAVNISAVQFRHPNLPELVIKILHEMKLPPEHLELELTEAAAMREPEKACSIMDNLHERGIRMSIDDFGTGYSSLSYLKKFKVYKLKIDQSFVRDIGTDTDDKAIVSAVISMAHSLGLKTIAEGVETVEQLDYLREQGCDEIQGYYYSKPLRAEEFEEFVRDRNRSDKDR